MNSEQLAALREPFAGDDLEWRVQRAGEKNEKAWAIVVPYVTARAIMDRLDEVVGPENWRNEVREIGGGFLQSIDIRIDGEWICRMDGAQITDIESVKGGISGALKRAAVLWGIGRYLYNIEGQLFANVHGGGAHYQPAKKGSYPSFRWDPPKLPAWALPQNGKQPTPPADRADDEQETETLRTLRSEVTGLIIRNRNFLAENRGYLTDEQIQYVTGKCDHAKQFVEAQEGDTDTLRAAKKKLTETIESMAAVTKGKKTA